jgi:hypothetical protein
MKDVVPVLLRPTCAIFTFRGVAGRVVLAVVERGRADKNGMNGGKE